MRRSVVALVLFTLTGLVALLSVLGEVEAQDSRSSRTLLFPINIPGPPGTPFTLFFYLRPRDPTRIDTVDTKSLFLTFERIPNELVSDVTAFFVSNRAKAELVGPYTIEMKLTSLRFGVPSVAFAAVALRPLSVEEQSELQARLTCMPRQKTQRCDLAYALRGYALVQILVKTTKSYSDVRRLLPRESDNGSREPGPQSQPWDLRDSKGAIVQAGSYFANLLVRYPDRTINSDTNPEGVSP